MLFDFVYMNYKPVGMEPNHADMFEPRLLTICKSNSQEHLLLHITRRERDHHPDRYFSNWNDKLGYMISNTAYPGMTVIRRQFYQRIRPIDIAKIAEWGT
jgi:hypothetical protein